MRNRRGLTATGFVLLLALVTGCLELPKRVSQKSIEPDAHQVKRASTATLQMATRLVVQPESDTYLSQGVWEDCHDPLSHAESALWAANGLRCGLLANTMPTQLEQLCMNEAVVLDPMLRSLTAGQAKLVPVNGPLSEIQLQTQDDLAEQPKIEQLQQVELAIEVTVTPRLNQGYMVQLRPMLQHGAKRPWWKAAEDGTKFEVEHARSQSRFENLQVSFPMTEKDILVVGCSQPPAQHLGDHLFRTTVPATQRLLVLQLITNSKPIENNSTRPHVAATLVR